MEGTSCQLRTVWLNPLHNVYLEQTLGVAVLVLPRVRLAHTTGEWHLGLGIEINPGLAFPTWGVKCGPRSLRVVYLYGFPPGCLPRFGSYRVHTRLQGTSMNQTADIRCRNIERTSHVDSNSCTCKFSANL